MNYRKKRYSKRMLIMLLCLAALLAIVVLAFWSSRIHEQRQNSIVDNMKDLSYIEYFHVFSGAKMSEIIKGGGRGYGIGGGLGSQFGQEDISLWRGTGDIDLSLRLEPYCLLRISDSQTTASSQYADLTVNYVQNSTDPDVSDLVEKIGFSYGQDWYVITSRGQIYEIADQAFFVDLFSFFDDETVLQPKVY